MYLYETHCHTAEGSKCATTKAADYVKFFKDLGYQGIFITDHFLNGNTTVNLTLGWEEQISEFCKGYEIAKAEGEKVGLDVFFGFEYSYGWCHLLTYGLDKEWLLNHPQMMKWSPVEFLNIARKDGATIVHAHPFRDKIDLVRLFPDHIDAVEVFNASQPEEANRRALYYAQMLNLPVTAGSDIHNINRTVLGVVKSKERFKSISDFRRLLEARSLNISEKQL